jgi:predicted DNA-binding ArsR family transcriptional regulator
MVKKFDLTTAYWLCEIISWMNHLRKKEKLDEEGWFYYSQNLIEERIGISSQRQNRIIKKLKSEGIINVKRKGSPPKNYYQIDYEKLVIVLYGESSKTIKIIDSKLLKQQDYYNSSNYKLSSMNNNVHGFEMYSTNKKIRPSYIRFALHIQKKQIENHPTKFKQYTPDQLNNQIKNGAQVIDQLVRLDKWDFCDEIKPAIEWGIQDDFWSLQIRSLAALRNKGSNGETKFTNIFDGWERSKNKKPEKKKFEDPRNPSRKVLRRGPDGFMHGVWEN